jgi:hypothetical protein
MKRALLGSLLALAAATPAAATTFVMVTDEDLLDQAEAVVYVRVLSADAAPVAGRPATDYLVEVEQLLKGDLAGGNLIVRVPGGFRPDGVGTRIWGAPEFREGERALLFLAPGRAGTFRILHLMLGAFREARVGGRAAFLRDLSEVAEVEAPGEPAGTRARYRQPRDRERFVDWLAARVHGGRPAADYFIAEEPGGLAPIFDRYAFFESNRGFKMRWFTFDEGGSESFRAHSSGQQGLTAQESFNAFQDGLRAWTNDANTNIRYVYGGTTGSLGGLIDADGLNSIVFNNQGNDPDLAAFDCSEGGVLAIGGPWINRSAPTRTFNGEQFHEIHEADIETNANISCFFATSPNRLAAARELFAHELGHTLGLAHTCDDPQFPCTNQALMAPFIHDDGRGAQLNADDRSAVSYLYASGGGPSGPAAPSNLAAQVVSGTQVHLTWQDNSSDETSFLVERRTGTSGPFQQIASLPANSTVYHDAGPLAAGTTYQYRVKAANASGAAASNTATATTSSTTPPPAAPTGLSAAPASADAIQLTWADQAGNETGFVVERRSPATEWETVAEPGANTIQVVVGLLDADTPYTFRVKARNATGDSGFSNEASATTADAGGPCVADDETLCLLGARFQVRVEWRNHHSLGDHGVGHAGAIAGSDRTGTFWFFNAANVELIVKALDAGIVNQQFWVFYGALSDVEYWITVRDTAAGLSKTYRNPPGQVCGAADNAAFPSPATAPAAAPVAPLRAVRLDAAPAAAPGPRGAACVPGTETLCLLGGRFELEVDWLDQRSLDTGTGKAVTGTDQSGYFWFFNSTNLELVTKFVDATSLPGNNFWFFYGALSDVNYTITVRDTVTGIVETYVNEPGEICGEADTASFPETVP